jgi:hypothetical protein
MDTMLSKNMKEANELVVRFPDKDHFDLLTVNKFLDPKLTETEKDNLFQSLLPIRMCASKFVIYLVGSIISEWTHCLKNTTKWPPQPSRNSRYIRIDSRHEINGFFSKTHLAISLRRS